MSTYTRKALPVLTAALILWAVLAFTQKAFLFKNGDLSLFLFDWTFLKESFLIPGGFLGWAGSFFTQFLLKPWLGALLWTVLLTIAGLLTVKVFQIPSGLAAIAALPVAILIIGNMSLGYGMYIIKAQDYFFAPTLGYLLMLGIMDAAWRLPKTWQKLSVLFISAFIGYPLAGVFALTGTLAAGIGMIFKSDNKKDRILIPAFSVIICVVAPLLLYGLYTRYRLADSWSMGLPLVSEQAWHTPIRLPYWILICLTITLAAFSNAISKVNCGKRYMAAVQCAIAVIAIGATYLFWFKDANFKTELEMSVAADRGDWKGVTDIYRKASGKNAGKEKKAYESMRKELAENGDEYNYGQILEKYENRFFEPTRLMSVLRDMALLKQNKALDQAFTMIDGSRPQKSRVQLPMTIQVGPLLYINYGLVNMAYRWCLEDHVEHGWNYSTLRCMAIHATVMNEPEFAAKFYDKLDRTLFFRRWSVAGRPRSHNAKAMSQALPYKEILPYMCYNDRMSTDGTMAETYLYHHFAHDRDAQASPEFDRTALLMAMRSKDVRLFWKAFANFISTSPDSRLPRHVQEAALLYNSLEKENLGIPFDKEVTDSYSAFLKYINQGMTNGNRMTAYPIWQRFGNTFFYYYYFVRDLQSF